MHGELMASVLLKGQARSWVLPLLCQLQTAKCDGLCCGRHGTNAASLSPGPPALHHACFASASTPCMHGRLSCVLAVAVGCFIFACRLWLPSIETRGGFSATNWNTAHHLPSVLICNSDKTRQCCCAQVVAAGRRKFFYHLDLAGGGVERVAGLFGREDKSLESFVASHDQDRPGGWVWNWAIVD